MNISAKIEEVLSEIPVNVKLVAVSKTKPIEYIQEAYDGGYRIFGENKPQELKTKYQELPKDIQWHFIGHLQTNKVKYIAPYVSLIHAVDSFKLLVEINKHALKNNRVIDCLIQFHIAQEEAKFGYSIEPFLNEIDSNDIMVLEGVNIIGIMGMASFTDNKDQVKAEFSNLKSIFSQLKTSVFSDNDNFKEISMGMSGDYISAIEQGSTIIRIGSSIFGSR